MLLQRCEDEFARGTFVSQRQVLLAGSRSKVHYVVSSTGNESRRPGPVNYASSSKSQESQDALESSEVERCKDAGPFIETSRGRRKLQERGNLGLGLAGVMVVGIGLVLGPLFVVVGLTMIGSSIISVRNSATKRRLRARFNTKRSRS